LPGNVRGAAVYHIMANDFGLTTWAVSNRGSAAQLAGCPLRGTDLTQAAPRADIFEKTMIPHLDAAYNLARWLKRNEQNAEDIVRQAYLRFDGFRGGDGPSWLLAVVRNTALTWLRRQMTAPQVTFDEKMHGPGSEAVTIEAK